MEEVGDEYLEDLAKRSLVSITKKRYNGKIKAVKIHDLLRDLCLRKARDEKFLLVINEFWGSFPEGVEISRRISISSYISDGFPNMYASLIQTILLFRYWPFQFCLRLRRLRVVDGMTVVEFRSFIDEIGELLHLRYLAVTIRPYGNRVKLQLPESFTKLQNLQTLIINCDSFSSTLYMTFGIWRMPQLRHLILLDGSLPDPTTGACGHILVLENLHTLTRIESFPCSERILEMKPNLKKLGITYSFGDIYETGWSQFGLNHLVHLQSVFKKNNVASEMTSKLITSSDLYFTE